VSYRWPFEDPAADDAAANAEAGPAPEPALDPASEPLAGPPADAAPPGEPEPRAEPPPPSPFASLRTTPGSVLVTAFDLLTRASGDVRRGSFYIGVIVLGTIAPIAVLAWGFAIAAEGEEFGGLSDAMSGSGGEWLVIATWLAFGGLIVAFVESRAVATALLAAKIDGRRFTLRDAVQRSRAVFWQVLVGIAIISIPVLIAQGLLEAWLGGVFHGASEITSITSAIVLAIVASPFAYVLSGIVIGDVGPVESARRSLRLFSVRRRTAVVVSLFALAAQYLTVFGASAGLDLIARVFESLGLGPQSGDVAIAAITVVILAVVFAIGSLLFTVAAIAVAPQVAMFLALTHATPGLDATRPVAASTSEPAAVAASPWSAPRRAPRRFRWLTLPMRGAIVLGAVSAVAGLAALSR
jgi:hypothetical protein